MSTELNIRCRLLRRQHPQEGRNSGFTLVETTVVMMILMVGLLAMTSTSVTVHSLRESDRDRRLALAGLESVIEDVRRISDASLGDDWSRDLIAAYAAGGTPGPQINLRGLEAWAGNPSVLTVQIITDETTTDAELGVALGMPRDLNNDGAVDDADVSLDARILPVIVRAQWAGVSGNRQMAQGFYVIGY